MTVLNGSLVGHFETRKSARCWEVLNMEAVIVETDR